MEVTSKDLYGIIQEVNTKAQVPAVINDNDDLFKIGALDSMAVVQFILAIEKKFQIKISKRDINFDTFSNFNNIKILIKSKLSQ